MDWLYSILGILIVGRILYSIWKFIHMIIYGTEEDIKAFIEKMDDDVDVGGDIDIDIDFD